MSSWTAQLLLTGLTQYPYLEGSRSNDWSNMAEARTELWIAVTVVGEGPEATSVLEKAMSNVMTYEEDGVIGWRAINPASDADQEEFTRAGQELLATFESTEVDGQLELPFEGSDV